MAVGKNKGLSKGGKKKGSKKPVDPFLKKEWYDVVAPGFVKTRSFCKTIASKSQGLKLASENLKGRVFETNIADITDSGEQGHRKIKFIVEEVSDRNCLTNFHSLCLTRDKLCSMVRKWQTLIEAVTKAKTADGYELRMFMIGFTKKSSNQVKKTSYASSQHIKKIRRKMVDAMNREITGNTLKDLLAKKILPDTIPKEIIHECQFIYPLQDVHIRKIKVTRRPAYDPSKLMELHSQVLEKSTSGAATGEKMEAEGTVTLGGTEPPVLTSV
ncbi:small ribosomal subunit protein eS1-like [Convolutriloba macropyga]|uniref:small ribosomal subunit protein eS1-like n=1 Tax=Convolutriloba macropyga TaxID=536237 RepID=UPI003F51B9FA